MTTGETAATERAVRRLGELVGIETPSGHIAGTRACFELFQQWLTPLLASTGSVVTEDGTPHLLWEATAQPRVLLLGHVDTVWPLGTLVHRPFAVHGERAVGPGVFDMKAGLVIAVEALELMADTSHVGVLITTDEEVGSITSRALIERLAARYNAVLVLEPGIAGAVKTARKGAGLYRITVNGRAAHAGLEPENGVNALTELARLVLRVEGLASVAEETTVTPTVARAGTVTNAVAARATLDVDVRAWTSAELERVDAALHTLTPDDEEASLELCGGINRYPMSTEQSRALVELARVTAAELGLAPVREARAGGASDGNFTAALGVPTLDGLGAVGDGAHAEHEWVDVSSLGTQARLVAGMLQRLRSTP